MRRRSSQAQRELLEWFVREVDALPYEFPPPLRGRIEAVRDLAAAALRAGAPDADPAEIDEHRRLASAATPLERRLLEIPREIVWELRADNLEAWRNAGQPGQVWIRWDAVEPRHQAIALSLATALSEIYVRRRTGGRPLGSRLTPEERRALTMFETPLTQVDAQTGWRHMVDAEAWKDDGRRESDPAARHARAMRWRRLQSRAEADPAHE